MLLPHFPTARMEYVSLHTMIHKKINLSSFAEKQSLLD